MVLRLPCLFYLYLKDNEPNAFLMSLVSISSLILIALGMATGSNCTGHGDGGSGQTWQLPVLGRQGRKALGGDDKGKSLEPSYVQVSPK